MSTPPPPSAFSFRHRFVKQNTLLMAAAFRAGNDTGSSTSSSAPLRGSSLPANHNNSSDNNKNNNNSKDGQNMPAVGSNSHHDSIRNMIAGAAKRQYVAPPTSPPQPAHCPNGGQGVGVEMHDDEHNLRTTCDGCTISKVKCDGGHPCKRCQRRRVECVYREKK